MNTAIATRLLWKEYRQQRNLWVALLFGATLLQLIFWFFIEEPRAGDGDVALVPLYVGVAAMMTALFAVCSAAISFAIEREEGTHLRLVSLSCPPALTLSIKFLVGLLGTALLFAVSAVIGASLSVGISAAIDTFKETSTTEAAGACYWVIAVVGGGLVVGAFCSLVFRKVLPAVIAATIAMFVGWPIVFSVWAAEIQMGSEGWLNRPDAVWLMIVLVGGIGVFGLIDFVLVRWWMNRSFSEMPKVRSRSLFRRVRVQRDGLDGSVTLEIGGSDRTEFEVLTPEQARMLPPPRPGLSLLYSNWGRGRSRVLRFLCWKEAAESRRMFLALLAVGILLAVCVGSAMRPAVWVDGNPQYRPRGEFAFLVMYSFFSTFVYGLMAFRGEQSGDSYRFLSDNGVTAGHVWLSKQLIWFSRLLLTHGLMLATIAAIAGVGAVNQILWALSGGTDVTGSFAVDWSQLSWLAGLCTVLTFVVVFYSVSQMASLAWRRAALSIFFALLCSILLGMWVGAAVNFDVPVPIAALPVAPALFVVTRLRTQGWLIGDDRFKRWLLPVASGVLGIAACWLTTAAWRIFEIPSAEPLVTTKTLDDGSTVEVVNGLTDAERAAILAPVSDDEAETAEIYRNYGAIGTDTLETCREAAARPDCAFGSPASEILSFGSFTRNHMKDFAERPLKQAKLEAANGNVAEALELHRQAFAIARHAAGRGANGDYGRWNTVTHSILKSLVDWSRTAGVTSEQVDQATSIVDEHFAKSLDPFAVSFAEHTVIRNTLLRPVDEQLSMRSEKYYANDEFFFDYMSVKFPGTRGRLDRLVDWYATRAARLIAEAQKIEARNGSGSLSLGTWYRQEAWKSRADLGGHAVADFRRWVQTTPLARGVIDDLGLSLVYSETDLKTQARGTQIVMRLWSAFHENEEFPQTLDELDLPTQVVIEPWSGRQFAWHPNGVPNEITTTSPRIPANTPFLFSGGPAGCYLEEIEEMVRVEGPFDSPPEVIPLNGGGGVEQSADGLANPAGAALQNPGAAAEPPLPEAANQAEQKDSAIAEFPGFGEMGGGMGATRAADASVRWEARRKFIVVEPSVNAAVIKTQPTVWLLATSSEEHEPAAGAESESRDESESNDQESKE